MSEWPKKKIRRCPQFCFGPCPTCGGTQYIRSDGTPATAREMLEQLTAGKKPGPRPSPFGFTSRR